MCARFWSVRQRDSWGSPKWRDGTPELQPDGPCTAPRQHWLSRGTWRRSSATRTSGRGPGSPLHWSPSCLSAPLLGKGTLLRRKMLIPEASWGPPLVWDLAAREET